MTRYSARNSRSCTTHACKRPHRQPQALQHGRVQDWSRARLCRSERGLAEPDRLVFWGATDDELDRSSHSHTKMQRRMNTVMKSAIVPIVRGCFGAGEKKRKIDRTDFKYSVSGVL